MIRQNLSTAIIIAACLGASACSDKAPDIQSAPTQQAPAAVAPALPEVATTLSAWAGDLASAQKSELCALDAVNGEAAVENKFGTTANQPVAFEGWVATTNLHRPEKFALVLDGASDFQVAGGTGTSRDDVAKAYGTNELASAGYKLELASLAIPAGDYVLTLTHDENGTTVACNTKLVLSAK